MPSFGIADHNSGGGTARQPSSPLDLGKGAARIQERRRSPSIFPTLPQPRQDAALASLSLSGCRAWNRQCGSRAGNLGVSLQVVGADPNALGESAIPTGVLAGRQAGHLPIAFPRHGSLDRPPLGREFVDRRDDQAGRGRSPPRTPSGGGSRFFTTRPTTEPACREQASKRGTRRRHRLQCSSRRPSVVT